MPSMSFTLCGVELVFSRRGGDEGNRVTWRSACSLRRVRGGSGWLRGRGRDLDVATVPPIVRRFDIRRIGKLFDGGI